MSPQGLRGLPPHLRTGPIARQVYRPMKLWCDVGRHVEPKTFPCDGCSHRVCARHSRWETNPYPRPYRRLCDDCQRKKDR